jgi:hypothetical protein
VTVDLRETFLAKDSKSFFGIVGIHGFNFGGECQVVFWLKRVERLVHLANNGDVTIICETVH